MMIPTKSIQTYTQKHPLSLLRIFLGVVFLSAGLHRLIYFSIAHENFSNLGITTVTPMLIVTIVMQVTAGTLLITNRHIIPAALIIIAIVIVGILVSLINANSSLYANFNELFILTSTPTNIMLHITYLVGVITLVLYQLSKNISKIKPSN